MTARVDSERKIFLTRDGAFWDVVQTAANLTRSVPNGRARIVAPAEMTCNKPKWFQVSLRVVARVMNPGGR